MDLFEMPGHVIRRLHQRSTAAFQRAMTEAGHDLTPVQFAALRVLDAEPGLDQATLAARIACDRATVGGVIERLVQKGLAQRSVSARDRRARLVRLTPEGKAMLAAVEGIVAGVQAQILPGLSDDERARFLALARKSLGPIADG